MDYGAAAKRVEELARSFKFAIDPEARIENLSVGQQQRVEILKALYRSADILILDEPTAVLTPQEARELFEILRTLTREGMAVIFISHKLDEVLEISDRVTVLRRGKKIETIPTEGADRGEPRADDGRTRGAAARREAAAQAGSRCSSVEDLEVLDDRGLDPRSRRLVRGARGRDRRDRRRRRQRPDRADRRDHGPAEARRRAAWSVGDRRHRCEREEALRRGARPHPRGPPAPRPRARVQPRRERPPPRLREAARLAHRLAQPAPDDPARATPAPALRRARRRADHARVRALGRQPAEGRARPRGRARPARPARRPADARTRRRGDRVRAPAPRRGARRGPRDPARLVRARGDLLALRPDPGHLRGPDRRRVPADREPGGARVRDDGRRPRTSEAVA